jgi:hypothetical protein
MRKCLFGFASAAVLLNGCAPHIAGTERPPTILARGNVYYDTQVVLGPCTDQAEAGILAAIATAAIAQGVNRIGDAISAAAKSETTVVLARRNVEIRRGQGLGPCVTVARGWFYRKPPSLGPNPAKAAFAVDPESSWRFNEDGDTPDKFWRAGLHLAATPEFYFQGKVVTSQDKAAYTILPMFASLDRPISNTPLRPSGKRNVLVAFAISDLGKPADLQKGGGTTISIGKMEPGTAVTFSGVSCFSTTVARGEAAVLSNTCPDDGKFDMLIRSPFESDWFSVALADKSKPLALQALVSETRSPSQFLAFVGDVFGATKGTLTQELQRALIPSVGDEADATELAAKEKADNEADVAQGKAIADLNACVASPGEPAKRVSARSSLRSYIAAARKAERPTSANSAHVDGIVTNGTDADPCKAALNAVVGG